MKRFKHMLTVILTAATFALLMSSCFGWYDWYDEPGPPPRLPATITTGHTIIESLQS